MTGNTYRWPTDATANATRTFTSPFGYVIKGLTTGYDFFTSPDETGLNVSNSIVTADLSWGYHLGAKNATGVYCRNANGSRYIFQVQEEALSGAPGQWAIMRDDNGTAKTLKRGTSANLSGAGAIVAAACVTDSSGVTHLGLSIGGAEAGEASDSNGLPSGHAGVYLSTIDSAAQIEVDHFTLYAATFS